MSQEFKKPQAIKNKYNYYLSGLTYKLWVVKNNRLFVCSPCLCQNMSCGTSPDKERQQLALATLSGIKDFKMFKIHNFKYILPEKRKIKG